jgi:hypothetical protein
MPLQATAGAASYDGFGGGPAVAANYIEDVFQTWLYTGTGASLTITNGIDLSGKGGLVWIKSRSAATGHRLTDTARGATKALESNSTAAEVTESTGVTAFGTTGFTIGANANYNTNAATYVSWTFCEQAKFFDVATFTSNGSGGATVSHNLGSTPGAIFIKRLDASGGQNWLVYHRSLTTPTNYYLALNTTDPQTNFGSAWISVSSTSFTLNGGLQSNSPYVAYLFAHDAGGFGNSGTDNVISCGSFTSTGQLVNLGWEPQWLLVKKSSGASDWLMFDNMRSATGGRAWRNFSGSGDETAWLKANLSGAESYDANYGYPAATGFYEQNFGGGTWVYIAIRRGPMRTPTTGTSVFSPTAWTGSSTTRVNTTGFVTDLNISRMRENFSSASNLGAYWVNRLTGESPYLRSNSTAAEATQTTGLTSFASNTAVTFGADGTVQAWNFDNNYRNYSFRRAPGFFDVVCYTGTGSATTFSHNLGVVPELMIVKKRSASDDWAVYANNDNTDFLLLNTTAATADDNTYWNDTSPTASVFTVGTNADVNTSAATYVAYLFATVAGVSKVGSYTGNGTTQTINCGFTAGARFVMVKATSTTGNWVTVDTNGINTGNDRALYFNNADVESFAYDWIDIDSTGFIVNETAVIAANTNGVTYIFLAIA